MHQEKPIFGSRVWLYCTILTIYLEIDLHFAGLAAQHTHRHATDMHFGRTETTDTQLRRTQTRICRRTRHFRSNRSEIATTLAKQHTLAARSSKLGRFEPDFNRCAPNPLVLAANWESHLFLCTEKTPFWDLLCGYTVQYSRFCVK